MQKKRTIAPSRIVRKIDDWPINELRITVRSFYDAQKMRIEMGNRMTRAGTLTEEWKARLLTRIEEFNGIESRLLGDVGDLLGYFPVSEWLLGVTGIGPTLAGVIIAEFADPRRAIRVSNMWSFAGLNVLNASDGEGLQGQAPGMKNVKALIEARKDPDSDEPGHRPWNAFLRTKLVGVAGPSFLRCPKSPYRKIYDDIKQRYEERAILAGTEALGPKWALLARDPEKRNAALEKARVKTEGKAWNAAHIHQAAIRYMIKMFLLDFWKEWRSTAGLEVTPSYAEAKLGQKHGT